MKNKNFLQGKKILFFSVKTFNLEEHIVNKLKQLGAYVDFYDERPNNSLFVKGVIRLKRSLYQKKINLYYKKILDDIGIVDYDYLFVNRGEVVPEFFLIEFTKRFPNCVKIYYNWDSFKNNQNPLRILNHFDYKYSFDHNDCEKYELKMRPLFFLDEFAKLKQHDKYENDLLFIGTTHSDRYTLTMKISEWCKGNYLSTKTFFYVQGLLVFIYKTLFDKSFKKTKLKDMNFTGLKSSEIIDLYDKSKVILDINHFAQKGLTMRTFESIGAQKKLITTNGDIKKYSFYNEKNIFIIDRENLNLNSDFFKTNYEPIDISVYKKLTLQGWIESLFLDNDSHDYWCN